MNKSGHFKGKEYYKVCFPAGNGTSDFYTAQPVFSPLHYVLPAKPVFLHRIVILNQVVNADERLVTRVLRKMVRGVVGHDGEVFLVYSFKSSIGMIRVHRKEHKIYADSRFKEDRILYLGPGTGC